MAKKTPKPAAVTQLLSHVWEHAQRATEHSWGRLNTTMRKALELAIGAGFEFSPADFELKGFRAGYWVGESMEWCYSMAVSEGNIAAAKAFEQWINREPIIADNVRVAERHSSFAHMAGDRQQERLHVGCRFVWKGESVKVTSFTGAGAAVACSYHAAEGEYDTERKVKKRYTITREDAIAERAERKERLGLLKQITAAIDGGHRARTEVIKDLGVTSQAEFDALPIAKLRKYAAKLPEAK